MSWLARSIANSLRLDDDDDEDEEEDDEEQHQKDDVQPSSTSNLNYPQSLEQRQEYLQQERYEEEEDRFDNQGRGVREDLSEFRETLTRQLWGVASFLAPPPPPPPLETHYRTDRSAGDHSRWDRWESSGQPVFGNVSGEEVLDSAADSGFRGDFGHFGGNVSNRISDISKLPYRSEDRIGHAVGITEEVLAFARNIAHHPETWLDFPLSEEEDMDDLDMSDAQLKHVFAIEHLSPRLAALRIELSPAHMSVGYFWKVYFVLLHSRLNKHDAEVLSTPQVVEARAMWMQELQKRAKSEPDWSGRSTFHSYDRTYQLDEDFDHTTSDDAPGISLRKFAFEPPTYHAANDFETEKHPVVNNEVQIIDKSVIEEEPATKIKDKELVTGASHKILIHDYDDDGDDWLQEHLESEGYCGAAFLAGNEEDVSFSDLEDDIDCTVPVKSKIISKGLDTSSRTS